MAVRKKHRDLLAGFVEELDWFIGEANRRPTMLENARDRILELLEKDKKRNK